MLPPWTREAILSHLTHTVTGFGRWDGVCGNALLNSPSDAVWLRGSTLLHFLPSSCSDGPDLGMNPLGCTHTKWWLVVREDWNVPPETWSAISKSTHTVSGWELRMTMRNKSPPQPTGSKLFQLWVEAWLGSVSGEARWFQDTQSTAQPSAAPPPGRGAGGKLLGLGGSPPPPLNLQQCQAPPALPVLGLGIFQLTGFVSECISNHQLVLWKLGKFQNTNRKTPWICRHILLSAWFLKNSDFWLLLLDPHIPASLNRKVSSYPFIQHRIGVEPQGLKALPVPSDWNVMRTRC